MIDLGEREIKLRLPERSVIFDRHSTIQFWDKDGKLILSVDPTDLSTIYWAYIGMKKEEKEEK